MLNHYQIESNLFGLLVQAIKEENPDPNEGIQNLLSVLTTHKANLDRQAVGRFPELEEYEASLEAAFACGEMIQALIENHPDEVNDNKSQAGRMMSLLVDVRHDLETVCWDVEDSIPKLRTLFNDTRSRLMTIH